MTDIIYQVTPVSPEAHLFEVCCKVGKPEPGGQKFSLPAWIPGSYMIRDFAKNIVSLDVSSAGHAVKVRKLDKQTWRCEPCQGSLEIVYRIYAWDLSVRSAHLDITHGYFNGTSVFMAIDKQTNRTCDVILNPPSGLRYQRWKVATSLQPAGALLREFGRYRAQNYDDLIDHPVEMGDFDVETFAVSGVPHDLVVSGKHRADLKRVKRDLAIICAHHVDLFGELPKMERYVFLVMCVGNGYGGLEHRSSTSLICSRDDLPLEHIAEVTDEYRAFLGLCSHEYFHTWNVKRIKPEVFIPYDLSQESHTRLLWVFEGITSYYDDLTLARTGLISVTSYLELLGKALTRLYQNPGRKVQTVTDSSFDAWTKFYKQDENAGNAIVSYYIKGAVIACALDLMIRSRCKTSANIVKSLDDVMRGLWKKYGETGLGVAEDALEAEIENLTGLDLKDFFSKALNSTEDLDMVPLFREFGVSLRFRCQQKSTDLGGKALEEDHNHRVDMGVTVIAEGGELRIRNIVTDSPAQQAGLSAGDRVIAIDNLKVILSNFEKTLSRYQPEETITVHAFRRDELMQFDVTLKPAPSNTCYFEITGDLGNWIEVSR